MALNVAPDAAAGDALAETPIPFNVTLAVADTSELLFTVPTGKRLRAFSLANRSLSKVSAHVSMVAGTSATVTDMELARKDAWSEADLDLPEGDYEFIGSTGDQPRVSGVAWVSAAS